MKLNAEPASRMQMLGIPVLFICFIFLSLLQVFENERITFCYISKHDQRKIICSQQRKTMKLLIVVLEKQFNGGSGHWFMWQLGFSVGWCRNTSHESFKSSLGVRSTSSCCVGLGGRNVLLRTRQSRVREVDTHASLLILFVSQWQTLFPNTDHNFILVPWALLSLVTSHKEVMCLSFALGPGELCYGCRSDICGWWGCIGNGDTASSWACLGSPKLCCCGRGGEIWIWFCWSNCPRVPHGTEMHCPQWA